ncbi:MAG TPA: GAF domain-containing protein [Geodermatophilus sp.]|nr:GAF domain-containing protein [Geodermatophilus sp.]
MTPPEPRSPASGAADIPVLSAAVRAAAAGGRLEATLQDIVAAAMEHTGATYGALGVLGSGGKRIDRFVVLGMDADTRARIGRLPAGEGVLGLLIAHPGPLRLQDLTTHPASVGFPPGHPPMHSFLGVPIRVGNSIFGTLYLTEKGGGSAFTEADEEAAQALAVAAGLAIENARLAERAEQRRAWALAGTEIATALLSGADPDFVLHSIAERVATLASADIAGVLVPAPDDDDALTIVTAVGADGAGMEADDFEGVRVPLHDSHLGEAHRSGQPLLLTDAGDQAVQGGRDPVLGELADRFGPALMVPLGGRPPLGTVVAMRLRGREPFGTETLELAAAFATQARVALELARSQQRERRLQVEADRDRIARDLHDHVVQRIFATGLALDRISRLLQKTAPEVAAQLAERVDELDGTIARIRTTIFELHETQEALGADLRGRLADVVRSITDGGQGPRPSLRIRGQEDDLPPSLVPDVVAVVRELVTNVVRHARASRVTVTIDIADEVRVVVADDGVGLPDVTVRSGLVNLGDRAERHGGRMSISTGPRGTEVRWMVPLPSQG